MQIISIRTAQNVNIRYEAASVGDRIIAFLIDAIIRILVYMGILSLIEATGINPTTAVIISIAIPLLLYHLLFEIFYNGQSLGKMVLELKVVRLDGAPPTVGLYIIRWLFRVLDIAMFSGAIAAIVIMINGKGQRLGDIAAGTAVVKLRKMAKVRRHELIKKEIESYKPVFYNVTSLNDKDIAIILETLDTYRKTANKTPILAAQKKAKEILDVKSDMPPVKFLYTIVKDYNYLTSGM